MISYLAAALSLAVLVKPAERDSIPRRFTELWQQTIAPLLQRPVWKDAKQRYDAPNLLMVPMHAAFALNQREWQQQFFTHFNAFVRSDPPVEYSSRDELSWLQYDYLVSEFLVLSAEVGQPVPAGLSELLRRQVVELWTVRPAWQWGRSPFKGMRARLAWKLSTPKAEKTYYRAIIDHEEYLFAITADLVRYDRLTGTHDSSARILGEILDVARAAFTQRVEPSRDGGWLFQPGVWADHPEYQFVGRYTKVAGMTALPLRDVAEDASHSFRFPLWLVSLQGAARDSSEAKYYSTLRRGLDRQFFAHVLKPPTPEFPAYRLTNWMDGRNGVYRWKYSDRGATWGYGPYQLSSTFTLGWWTFLGSSRIKSAYADEFRRYPFPPVVLATYFADLGDTNLVSPKAVSDPLMAFRELLLYLSPRIPTS